MDVGPARVLLSHYLMPSAFRYGSFDGDQKQHSAIQQQQQQQQQQDSLRKEQQMQQHRKEPPLQDQDQAGIRMMAIAPTQQLVLQKNHSTSS